MNKLNNQSKNIYDDGNIPEIDLPRNNADNKIKSESQTIKPDKISLEKKNEDE